MNILRTKPSGFTIVELLVVVAVIGILASITVVAYTQIQKDSRTAALTAGLTQAAKAVTLKTSQNNGIPPTNLSEANINSQGKVTYQYRSTSSGGFCITALYDGATPYNVTDKKEPSTGPCDGHSGGVDYCPDNSFIPINGYYCDGTLDSVATLSSNAVKMSSTAAGVPSQAPAEFVGRQTARDNYLGDSFDVTPGEIYCVEGWAATQSSAVRHGIGLQINNGTTNNWISAGYVNPPAATWNKISGCITIPSGFITGRVWSQNDGTAGASANVAWYQTAIKVTKQ